MDRTRGRDGESSRRFVIGWMCLVVALVAGCASDPVEESPWREEIEAARARATSDFQREVLEDGVITKAEYDEAVDRLLDCLEDRGFRASAQEMYGTYSYSVAGGGPAADAAMDECSAGTTTVIEPLHISMRGNPDNVPSRQLRAECFVRNGLADEGFGAEEWGEWFTTTPEIAPNGQALYEDAVQQCLLNPTYDLTE